LNGSWPHYGRWCGSHNGVYGISSAADAELLSLDVGSPDHLGPFLNLFGDELAEVSGRAGDQRAAELEQPRLELRILERCVDLSVEHVDDPDRRCLRRTDAEQRGGIVARNEVAHGRDVRQPLPSPGARHRQGAQLAGPDLLYRQRRGAEQNLHLSAKQVGHHGSPARHVNQVDPGHHLEKLASNMRRLVGTLSRPGGNVTGVVFTSTDLTAKRLGVLHELVPKSASIAALFDPAAPEAELQMRETEEASDSINHRLDQTTVVAHSAKRNFRRS